MKKQQNVNSLFKITKIKKLMPIKNIANKSFNVYFKSYPRFEKVNLKIQDLLTDKNILKRRSSERNFLKPISFGDISTLLFYSTGRNLRKTKNEHRFYPSAGGLFPLEIYLINQRISGPLRKGIYHFNVKNNLLELISLKTNIMSAFAEPFLKKASCLILVTAVVGRTSVKYGSRAFRYIFIEAGHVGQNIYLCSKSLGLKCCAIGGFCDDEVIKHLDIDEKIEVPVYAIAVGK